eukprot:9284345-Pyramimonas_sp.AAC.2
MTTFLTTERQNVPSSPTFSLVLDVAVVTTVCTRNIRRTASVVPVPFRSDEEDAPATISLRRRSLR